MSQQDLIIYNTDDGKVSVALYTRDGNVWLSQAQLADLFATSVPNISMHVSKIFQENELQHNAVVKECLTTAADGKRADDQELEELRQLECSIKER